jgi:hypothetical protein
MTLFVTSSLVSAPTFDTFQFITAPVLNGASLTARINIPDCASFGTFGVLQKLLVTAMVNGATESLPDGSDYFRVTERGVWDVTLTTNTANGIFTDFAAIREYRDDTGDYHDPVKPSGSVSEDYVVLSAGPMTPASGTPWYGFTSLLNLQLSPSTGEWPFVANFELTYDGPESTTGVLDFGDGTAPTALPNLDSAPLHVEHIYHRVGQFAPQLSAPRAGYPGNVTLRAIGDVNVNGLVAYQQATVTPDKSSSADPTFTFTFHGLSLDGGNAS